MDIWYTHMSICCVWTIYTCPHINHTIPLQTKPCMTNIWKPYQKDLTVVSRPYCFISVVMCSVWTILTQLPILICTTWNTLIQLLLSYYPDIRKCVCFCPLYPCIFLKQYGVPLSKCVGISPALPLCVVHSMVWYGGVWVIYINTTRIIVASN